MTRLLPRCLQATNESHGQEEYPQSWMVRRKMMHGERAQENGPSLLSELRSCSMRRDLECGRRIHARAVASDNVSNMYVLTALINMYSKCASMADARRVFDSIQTPDVVSWSALLLGYAENGDGYVALDLFSRMKAVACVPNSVTHVAALKACTSLAVNGGDSVEQYWRLGRAIHSEAGYQMNRYVQNTLIHMYSTFKIIKDARRVFDSMRSPDVVSWNALLLGYADTGQGDVALDLFSTMKAIGCAPNSVTYVAALKSCTHIAVNRDGSMETSLERGREIHLEVGRHLNNYVQNTLIDMYAKCRSMEEAVCVFNSMERPDVVSWNALLLGYAENGQGQASLELFSRMKARGYAPNSVTYVAVLKACTSLAVNGGDKLEKYLKVGREVHAEIGCHLNPYVQTTLIAMYAKLGSMVDARRVFDSIRKPDILSWNALLLGYAEDGDGQVALALFSRMKSAECAPDSVTYMAVLKACTSLQCLERGREIHLEIGCHLNDHVKNTLIDMYSKCGSMHSARHVFDSIRMPNVVSWTALIMGYAENGDGHAALDFFSRMRAGGCAPDAVTYMAALKACSLVGALAIGRKLHAEISVFTCRVVTCLVDFYAKCGSMAEAREVFNSHSRERDVSTWNALLEGYGRFGDTVSVFNLFGQMQDKGLQPDAVTFVCLLLCCSHSGLVEKAKEYFELMTVKYGITPSVTHYTCMIDVLGRANQLNEAIAMLQSMPCIPDSVTWTALLSACGKWKNVEIGRLAFQALVDMDKKDPSAYVLMAHIYGSKGMHEEQERVLESRRSLEPLLSQRQMRE